MDNSAKCRNPGHDYRICDSLKANTKKKEAAKYLVHLALETSFNVHTLKYSFLVTKQDITFPSLLPSAHLQSRRDTRLNEAESAVSQRLDADQHVDVLDELLMF